MKSKITPIVSFLCILTFFLGPTVLAQSPMKLTSQIPVSQTIAKSKTLSNPLEESNTIFSSRERPYKLDSDGADRIQPVPSPLIDKSESGPMRITQPKVVTPTTAQLSAVNKMVDEKVSTLKLQAHTSITIPEQDEVALSYNSSTGKIELVALNNRGLVLQEVTTPSLNSVLVLEGNNNDNNLLIDDTVLDLGIHIVYDGGGEHTERGDILTLENTGSPWEEVVSTAFNASSGTIVVSGKSSVTYTGLEPIIILGTGSGTLFVNLPNVPNPDVVISSGTSPNLSVVSGSTFENVIFNNDFDNYVINGGTDIDNVSFQGVDAAFDGNMTLNFDTDDLVTFETTETNVASGDLTVTSGFLTVSANVTTTGNIDFTSERNTIVNNNATVSVTDGAISMAGGTAIVMNDVYNGILLEDGNLTATTGSITLTGTASNDGASSKTIGVYAIGTSLLETVSGDISITGTGASSGLDRMSGIRINDNAENAAILRSEDGDIILNGIGGNGTGDFQTGVVIDGLNPIQLTGNGSLDVTGIGSTGANSNRGIGIQFAAITVADGDVTMSGTSGDGNEFLSGISMGFGASIQLTGSGALSMTGTSGSGVFGTGVNIFNATIALGDGDIVINGTGNAGSGNSQRGINIFDGASITTTNGDIAITGNAGTAPANFHMGIFTDSASIGTTGSGDITLNGTGGIGNDRNQGLGIQTSNITSAGGTISLSGQGGDGNNFNYGIFIFSTTINDVIDGDIAINGTGGNGSQAQIGIFILNNSAINSTTGNLTIHGQGGTASGGDTGTYFINSSINSAGGITTINGQGGGGGPFNEGIVIENTVINDTAGGDISLNGTGSSTATGTENQGIFISQGIVQTTTTGAITMTGVAGNGSSNNQGVVVTSSTVNAADGDIVLDGTGGANTSGNQNSGVQIETNTIVETTGNGAINITGLGGNGTGIFNIGIALGNAATVQASGNGMVTFDGTGGAGFSGNYGVFIDTANPMVSANGGGISITGVAGSGAGNLNTGIRVTGASITELGSGTVSLNGTGGSGAGSGVEMGVWLVTTPVNSNGGEISITGAGGSGTGNFTVGIYMDGAILDATNLGAITLEGIGGSGAEGVMGVFLLDSSFTSISGAIMATGTAGVGTGNFANGIYMEDSALDAGSGNITLDGIGGSGDTTNEGILSFTSSITTVDGDIQITGESIDTTGDFNEGIAFIDNIVEATNGNVSLVGTASSAIYPGIMIFTANVPIIAGSTITATTAVGPINTPEGIPTTAIFEAPSTIVNGAISPGSYTELSIGQATITGDFNLTSGSLEVKIDNLTTPGTDYDQIAVTGMVDVTGATLTLVDNTTESGELCDEMIIIDNDDTDTIIGEFAGASEGTDISFNGELWRISYVGGDGNDVVLAFNPGMVAAPICMDITLQLDANGNPIIITPADVDGGTLMGCDFESLSIDMDTFDCSNVGPNDVTLTVTDIFGNMNTCTAIVTVEDVTPPVIGCPADLIASTDDDSCTAVVVFAQPSVIDNCSAAGDIIITQVTGIPSGGTFPQGVNQVGFSATDEAGNVSFCSFTITVEDNTDPVAVCMDATVTLDAFGNATITAAAVNGGSTDNCGISSSSVDITSFTCADIGPNTVILTVTDINGNTDTCEAIVTVVDTTAPVAVCQDITVELGPDGTVTIDGSLMDDGSSDSCGAGTLTFTTDPAVLSCSDIGQRFVDLIVTDESGNSSTCNAIVTVEDNLDPVLVCQDTTIELGPDGTATIDPMALLDMTNPLDNCGIDVLSVDVTEVNCNDVGGTIAITVFASDNAGNFSSCVATVTVVDTSGPVFDQASLPQGPLTRLIDPATGFYRLEDFRVGVSSTDNCSEGLLPISVSQTPFAGTPLTEGTYDITLTAMDEAGNETDHVFVLMVEPALGVGDNELTLSTLTMYPNPASDKVILSNPQNIQLRDIQVYDLTGRLVQKVDLSETLSETVIDVSTLQSATYMFVISTEKASITKQIIKE